MTARLPFVTPADVADASLEAERRALADARARAWPAPQLAGKFWWPRDDFSTPADNLCWHIPPSPDGDFRCVRPLGHRGRHHHEWSPCIRDYSHRDTASREAGKTSPLEEVLRVYAGSDGAATRALFARLEALGPAGAIAVNLFRAQKNSARAKVYRGGGHRGAAYDRKQWAIDNLAAILAATAEACGIAWGWGRDPEQPVHDVVLYVDLPTGQVSFHTASRGDGPDYPGQWDGVRNASPGRICSWCARLLEGA